MCKPLTTQRLHQETLAFRGTTGDSTRAHRARFRAAFKDVHSGRIELARMPDGQPAPMHLICGLPAEWIAERDDTGAPTALLPGIIAGFVRDERFYTREEAANCELSD